MEAASRPTTGDYHSSWSSQVKAAGEGDKSLLRESFPALSFTDDGI